MAKIKHISLNICEEEQLHAQAMEFLKQENADIVALQEIYNSPSPSAPEKYRFLPVLLRDLGYEHYYFGAEFLDSRFEFPSPQGNLILSKFPILRAKTISLLGKYSEVTKDTIKEKMPRNMVCIEMDIIGIRVYVCNVHGVWGDRGDDTPDRISMMEKIIAEVAGKTKTVVSGDFNLNERIFFHKMDNRVTLDHWRETKSVKILEANLVNVFKNERLTTFNMRIKDQKTTTYGTAVVDMTFVSKDIKVLSKSCPDVHISDHLPVITELEV